MSMKPGATMQPVASTTRPASAARSGATAMIRSPASATFARRPGAPVPSRTVPSRMSQSNARGALRPARRRGRSGLRLLDLDALHLVAGLDAVDHVHARRHLAEDRVVVVEVRRRGKANVELATRRIRALRTGHRHGPAHVL